MNFLDFDDEPQEVRVETKEAFNPENPAAGIYDISQELYRSANAVANSDLQLIQQNSGAYIWNRDCPYDPTKSASAGFGTVFHANVLEPELESEIIIAPSQSRTTKMFADFVAERSDDNKTILLESELTKLRLMRDSAYAHPTVRDLLTAEGDNEQSIFVQDPRGFMRKIRPDRNLFKVAKVMADLKTTADLEDWRSDVPWKNPLFSMGYGHTAAYYMDTASLHYGEEINEYVFIVVQTTADFSGRYPVTAIPLTREEAEHYGFFDQMNANLDKYGVCLASGDWRGIERFPQIKGY